MVIINPYSQYDHGKNWGQYNQLVHEINKIGIISTLIGSEKELNFFNSDVWDSKFINLIGQLEIKQLVDLISKSKIVICNEGGVQHICVQCHKMAIVIINKPTPWRVLRNENINLYKPSVKQVMNILNLFL